MSKFLFVIAFLLAIPATSFALTTGDTGIIETGTAVYGQEQANVSLGTYLGTNVIVPFFGLLGVIFLVLTVYAGILWMTSGGNVESVSKAKRILVHALIGMLVIMLAYGATRFVFLAVSGNL